MTKRTLGLALLIGLAALPLQAGVVFEVRTTDHDTGQSYDSRIVAQGHLLATTIGGKEGGALSGKVIFDSHAKKATIVDDASRSVIVLDQEAIAGLGDMMQQTLGMMSEALKNLPESQRKQYEEMMKQRMPQAATGPAWKLVKSDERGTQAGYPCVKYDVIQGGKRARELWVTDWSRIEGGSEVSGLFRDLGAFFEEMMAALSSATGLPPVMEGNAFELLKDLDGFPVLTREFENGSLDNESILRSVTRKTLDAVEFEPPAGYERRQMMQ